MKRISFIILICFLSVNLYSQPTNYIGFWAFNNDGLDLSGHNLDGSISGNVFYASGKFGQALSLTGNGYVTMGDAPSLNIANKEFSISVWIKTNDRATRQGIVDKFNSAGKVIYSPGGYVLEKGLTPGNIRFQLGIGAPNLVVIDASANFYDNNWHHIAVTRTNDVVKLFFDGSLLGSSSCSGMIFSNTTRPFSIGTFAQIGGFFIGSIDDVKVYNYSLTDAQIRGVFEESVNTLNLEDLTKSFLDQNKKIEQLNQEMKILKDKIEKLSAVSK